MTTLNNEIRELRINEARELSDKDLDHVTGGVEAVRKTDTDRQETFLKTAMTDVLVSSY